VPELKSRSAASAAIELEYRSAGILPALAAFEFDVFRSVFEFDVFLSAAKDIRSRNFGTGVRLFID
jgi:hypothetical protein